MRLQVYFWTVLCSSITFLISLKLLKVFSFIKYSPIGWTKKMHVFQDSEPLVKWFMLWIAVIVILTLLFALGEWLKKIRIDFVAVFFSVAIVWLIEWSIQKTPYIHKFSIPLAVIIAIHLLWILETAVYHAKVRSLDARNKLPNSI